MRRRAFLKVLAAGALPWSRKALAQASPTKLPVIGFLGTGAKAAGARYYDGFPQGMREFGYVVGRDFAFEDRYAGGDLTRLPALAEELVRLKPDVIVTAPTAGALATKKATSSIPIVVVAVTDPVGFGLVLSEARPGTNVTGILSRVAGMPGKQLEIALDIVPHAAKIGVLINGNDPSNVIQRREVEVAVANISASLAPVEVRSTDEIGSAFEKFVRQGASIAIVFGDPMFVSARRQIAAIAIALRLPTVYNFREHVEDGGLISYGTNVRESFRRAAYFATRILKGTKPDDLPVEFPTRLEMVINLATAKAIGVTIPSTMIARADEVIE